MKTLPKNFRVGTKVLLEDGTNKFHEVIEIAEHRKHFKVEKNYGGSWQFGHVLKFTNK